MDRITVTYTCSECGSEHVERKVTQVWDVGTQSWLCDDLEEETYCHNCGEEGMPLEPLGIGGSHE